MIKECSIIFQDLYAYGCCNTFTIGVTYANG